MKWFEEIMQGTGLTQAELARKLGKSLQSVRIWCGTTKLQRPLTGIDLRVLVKMKQLSGMSWSKVGKMLEDEFSDD